MSQYFTTNDQVRIEYQDHGNKASQTVLIFLHGFSGSSDYFIRNYETLGGYRVIAPTLRGHGNSGRCAHGHHVSRLAKDLSELFDHVSGLQNAKNIIGIGCSIGSAILWSYSELFGCRPFTGMIFVDQAPFQNNATDGSWRNGSKGCFDAASMGYNQAVMVHAPDVAWTGLIQGCLAYHQAPDQFQHITKDQKQSDFNYFFNISKQADSVWLSKLMQDHTNLDWRSTVANAISVPCLVLASKYSGAFPVEGPLTLVSLINEQGQHANKQLASAEVVDWGGHWMYYENPTAFKQQIDSFTARLS